MKLTKYWYISLIVLFSCQNDKTETIQETQKTKNTEVSKVKADSLPFSENILIIDTITKENDSDFIESIKKKIPQKKEKPAQIEMSDPEPDELYKFPKEKYYRLIKSQKFYDDSVKFYSWFMRSEYWRKEYGYPDSAEYHNHYLHFWKDRVNTIKSDYDWGE